MTLLWSYLFAFIFLIAHIAAYHLPKLPLWKNCLIQYDQFSKKPELERLMKVDEPPDWIVGENIPKEVAQHNAIYDMILVERYHDPPKTSFGLFLPKIEGKDKKYVGRVISVPKEYGLESENGRLQPIQDIAPFKVGDDVLLKVRKNLSQSSILFET